jgi:hypothetical protein
VGAPPVKSKMCSRKLVFQKYETFSRAVRENSLIEVSDLQCGLKDPWTWTLGKGKGGTSEKQICLVAYKGS